MPSDTVGNGALVPFSGEGSDSVAVYPLNHGLSLPISRVAISWSRGNSLRVSLFAEPSAATPDSQAASGAKVVEVKLSGEDPEISDSNWRRIAYGSVTPFALLQSRRSSLAALSKSPSPYHVDWWEHVLEYSKDIASLLGGPKLSPGPIIEDPNAIATKCEEPTCLKAAWELLEMFYVDKRSQAWLPERLVDWLADFDSLFTSTHETIHGKLVNFQKELVNIQVIEDDPRYWEVMSSALSVGWLDIVVKMLRLHGSYQLDQLSSRERENGLVEVVAVLISKMPRLRPESAVENLGECFKSKPDFIKAWEKWRSQITKLDCSPFWIQCDNQQTCDGLRNLLQVMLGNTESLCTATCHWIELYVSHFLYIRPFTTGIESMYNLAQKCMQLKPPSSIHKLTGLMIGILGDNTEVVLAECSREFAESAKHQEAAAAWEKRFDNMVTQAGKDKVHYDKLMGKAGIKIGELENDLALMKEEADDLDASLQACKKEKEQAEKDLIARGEALVAKESELATLRAELETLGKTLSEQEKKSAESLALAKSDMDALTQATSEEIKKAAEAHAEALATKDAEIASQLAKIKGLEDELATEKAKATEAREQAADIALDNRERGFYLAKDQAQHLYPNLDFSAMGVMKEITAEGLVGPDDPPLIDQNLWAATEEEEEEEIGEEGNNE